MRLRLDLRPSMAPVLSAGEAIDDADLRRMGARLAAGLPILRAALAEGLLPDLAAELPEDAERRAAAWRSRGREGADRLLLLGEPFACRAVGLLASAGAGDLVRVVDQPDAERLGAALQGSRRPRVLLLPGPRWLSALLACAALPADRVEVVEGARLRPLAETPALADLPPTDGRYAALGTAALALAGFVGLPLEPLRIARRAALTICLESPERANPSLRLAALARVFEAREPSAAPALLASGRPLRRWSDWAASCAMAARSRLALSPHLREHRGGSPLAGGLDDEALGQRLALGMRGPWSLLLRAEPRGGPLDEALRQQEEALLRLLARQDRPAVRVLLPDDGPASLAELCAWWTVGMLLAAALDAPEPLALDGADALRADLPAGP